MLIPNTHLVAPTKPTKQGKHHWHNYHDKYLNLNWIIVLHLKGFPKIKAVSPLEKEEVIFSMYMETQREKMEICPFTSFCCVYSPP